MFTVSRNTEITTGLVCGFIKQHRSELPRYEKLKNYYDGEHDIKTRRKRSVLANNKLVCNHPKYITDTATGYFAGNPIKYSSEQDITALTNILRQADAETQDADLALRSSIYGKAYEFLYANEQGQPRFASISPQNAFVIYDDTVEQKELAGVYYYPVVDSATNKQNGYAVYVSFPDKLKQFTVNASFTPDGSVAETQNGFGEVQITENYNNTFCNGDFEPVLSLIDAYNVLQSDRVNDKEQFVEAILLIKGQTFGDTNDEKSETYKALKENGLLELDVDASAEWLTRQFDENSVEVLRTSLEQDIHKFSNVPCMSDKDFAGNASGVAMRYKLLGFEQLTKIKERYFKETIRKRLRMLCTYCEKTSKGKIDPDSINIKFSRALPVNETEIAQMVSELNGLVPDDVLLSLLPFIDDPKAAAEQMAKLKQESQAAMFNTAPSELMSDEQ